MSGNNENEKVGPAIGIDLGTWKCCVGVVREGKVEIFENERSSKTTPSYVAFTETERIIGENAKSQVALNPTNTVYGVKRIIGRKFDDPSLQDIKDTFPFTLNQDDRGKPLIEVTYKGNTKNLYPEQVTAMLLTKMKSVAESHLGCQVRDAVISVPAYFNNDQRQATKDAGAIAGLKVLKLINEPTAAALAYWDNKAPMEETICLVDLGGGTLDVSIIRLEGNKGITVLKTHGNTSFGGMDFDQRLAKHFGKEFFKLNNHNISENKKASERLRLACEKLKHTLSLLPTGRIQLDCLAMNTDLESSISRDTFSNLCHMNFEQSLYSVLTKTLLGSEQPCEEQPVDKFNRVVLVGGSTRIPYVQELLKNILGKDLDKSVNPDEAVAHGAAIMAALLGKEPSWPDVVVRDVNAHTLLMEVEHGRDIVFHRNSPQAAKRIDITSAQELNPRYNLFEILSDFETKGREATRLIGSGKLGDLANHLKSKSLFIDEICGVFGVKSVSGKDRSLPLPKDYSQNTVKQLTITVMCEQEDEFRADEENEKRRLVVLSDLEAYCFRNKPLVEELSAHGSGSEELKNEFINLCDDTIDWLDCNPEATEEDCKKKIEKLVEMRDCLIPPLPPPPPPDVDNIHSDSVAPRAGPTIDLNVGLTKVDRMSIGAERQTRTNRRTGDHHLMEPSPAIHGDEWVYLPPAERSGYQSNEQPEDPFAPWEPVINSTDPAHTIPHSDVADRNRDTARDGFNRAGTSTASKRPLDGDMGTHDGDMGTHGKQLCPLNRSQAPPSRPKLLQGNKFGRHTEARALSWQLRSAVPAHGDAKDLNSPGNDPVPNDNRLSNRHARHAVRNDRVGTSSGADTRIQMTLDGSNSSFESMKYLKGTPEGGSPDKPSLPRRALNRVCKMFTPSPKAKTPCQSKKKDKNEGNEMKWR